MSNENYAIALKSITITSNDAIVAATTAMSGGALYLKHNCYITLTVLLRFNIKTLNHNGFCPNRR